MPDDAAGQRGRAAPTAVVVGLDCITGLQTARILASRGVPVVGVAATDAHPFTRTRAVDSVVTAATSGPALVDALLRTAPALRDRPVLVPCSDASVLTIARHRDELEGHFRIVLPELSVIETLMDKLRFHDFAERIGLPVPALRLVDDRSAAIRAANELQFPCILKPALKTPLWERHSRAKVHRVETPDQLLALHDRFGSLGVSLLIQQWIDGPDAELYSCNCYYDRQGNPLVTFVARKLRQWPPRTGTSCLGEECRNDAVLDLTLRTFGAARFAGLGYLEVKRDRATSRHYVIEANVGRPTGRSAIAEAGGVELLYTMYCDAVGLPLPENRTQGYRGARWVYWRQDLRSAAYYWHRGELTIGEWCRSLRGKKASAVWSWRDPVPAVAAACADIRSIAEPLAATVVGGLTRRREVGRRAASTGSELPRPSPTQQSPAAPSARR